MDDVRYMISEASKRVGVESHTLRYWEEELDLPVNRNEMGHRYYKDADIELLKTVKKLKEQGFQLKAIKLLLPDLKQINTLDNNAMDRLKEELNGKVNEMWIDNIDEKNIGNKDSDSRNIDSKNTDERENSKDENNNVISLEQKNETGFISNENDHHNEIEADTGDKMVQFKAIMNQIIMSALKENNAELSQEICSAVIDNVIKEMHFLMRLQEEREEERFRKFDATLRDYQRSRLHAAAMLEGKGRRKSKFFKKHKVYI